MTNLNQKYKDRQPLKTVEIIKKFFIDKGFNIDEEIKEISEAGTYWCGISLKYLGEEIVHSNGKGTSEEYSLASGYSELYERFCAGFGTYNGGFIYSKKFFELNFKKHNYYCHPNEKIESFDLIRNSCNRFKEFFNLIQDNDNYILKYYNLCLNNRNLNGSITVPFTNFNNLDDKKFFNKFILDVISGSSGLCAGNSTEEALVQGLSEVYEHYAHVQLYNNRQQLYYQLNLDQINISDNLKEIITKIKKLNYNIYIYDLSYNFNVPVIMTVIVNPANHTWFIDLGANPIINIAIERTLTEMYQGVVNINSEIKFNMIPGNKASHSDGMRDNSSCVVSRSLYPEEILLNRIIVDKYNDKIFLNENTISNIDLMNHMRNINKINGFNVYFYDLSLCEDMKAFQIFIDNVEIYDKSSFDNLRQDYIEYLLKLNFNIFNQYDLLLNNNDINILYLLGLINERNKILFNDVDYEIFCSIIFPSQYKIIFTDSSSIKDFYEHLKFLIMENENRYKFLKSEFLYYYYLFSYSTNSFDINKIKLLFKQLGFNIETLDNDYHLASFLKTENMYKKLIFNSLYDIYHQSEIKDLINIFIK